MSPVEPGKADDAQDEDPFLDIELMEVESMTVNHGFIPEGLASWRRWRKNAAT